MLGLGVGATTRKKWKLPVPAALLFVYAAWSKLIPIKVKAENHQV